MLYPSPVRLHERLSLPLLLICFLNFQPIEELWRAWKLAFCVQLFWLVFKKVLHNFAFWISLKCIIFNFPHSYTLVSALFSVSFFCFLGQRPDFLNSSADFYTAKYCVHLWYNRSISLEVYQPAHYSSSHISRPPNMILFSPIKL